jgi:hypothetical protein
VGESAAGREVSAPTRPPSVPFESDLVGGADDDFGHGSPAWAGDDVVDGFGDVVGVRSGIARLSEPGASRVVRESGGEVLTTDATSAASSRATAAAILRLP